MLPKQLFIVIHNVLLVVLHQDVDELLRVLSDRRVARIRYFDSVLVADDRDSLAQDTDVGAEIEDLLRHLSI